MPGRIGSLRRSRGAKRSSSDAGSPAVSEPNTK